MSRKRWMSATEALGRGLVTKAQLRAAKLTKTGGPKLNWSPAEERLSMLLSIRWPGTFEREVRVVPERKFRWDFADRTLKLAIEVDGFRNHGLSRRGWSASHEKDCLGREAGWTIIRIPAMQVMKDPPAVMAHIAAMRRQVLAHSARPE